MSLAVRTIRIDDLKNPKLTNNAYRALQHAELNPVALTVDSVLEAAKSTTGLKDFGQETFTHRLSAWIEEVLGNPNRTQLSRNSFVEDCVKYAAIRMRLHDLLRAHPEIHDIEIKAPIIVLGPFRSGTTHLQNLLAADPGLRSLPFWEAQEPVPDKTRLRDRNYDDERRRAYTRAANQRRGMLPYLAAMRPLESDIADEETELQGPNFSIGWWRSTALMRRDLDYASDRELNEHYRYMKTMLKALQWQRGPSRWVLKSVHHTENIPTLLDTFPDAIIVMTHRDPIDILKSVTTLAAYLARLEYHKIDTELIGMYWVARIETILKSMKRDRELIAPERLVDVKFEEFVRDQLGTIQRIRTAGGLKPSELQSLRTTDYLTSHPRNKDGKINYNLHKDFQIDESELRRRFDLYYNDLPSADPA